MNIGGLTIEMAADLVRLRTDMADAKRMVGDATSSIGKAAGLAKNALGAIGIGLGVAGFASWIKGAIDAADASSKLAQTAGVSTKEVAGLKLAFELGGSSSQGMATSMAKLQKQIVEGNKAFDQLGVKTRNTDGTLRGSRAVFSDVAEAISKTEDKTLKAALAQEIFGKSGAELLPILNGGAKGLREMDETALALGLTLDKETGDAAEEFNDTLDLLQKAGGGVATQLAAKMLPALNAAAGGLLEMVKDGNLVDKMADGLVVTFKLLYSGVLVVMEVFSTLGKLLGGTIARLMAELSGLGEAVVKVFQGDFKGAAEAAQNGFKQSAQISREMSADVRSGWQQTGGAISKVWDETQSTTVKAMAEMGKATKGSTVATKEQEEAAKKAAEELKKLRQAADDYVRSSVQKVAAAQAELDIGRPLTEGEKLYRKAVEDNTAGKAKFTTAQLAGIKVRGEELDAISAEIKWMRDSRAESEKSVEEALKFVESTRAETDKLREKNATLLLTREELAAHHTAELLALADSKEKQAALLEEAGLQTDKIRLLREGAKAIREQVAVINDGAALEAIKAQRDEWAKLTDDIGRGLTDSLFRAFESGKSFFGTFWDGIKNLFKTTVLKMLIQPVQAGVTGAVGGLLSSGSAFAGTGGTGGSGGSLGGLLSAFGGGGSVFGSSFSAGAQLVGAGASGTAFSAAGSLLGSGQIASGLGVGAGALAPYAAAFGLGSKVGGLIGGGYSAGTAGTIATYVGAAIGSYFGPLGTGIGAALGGVVNRLFGKKLVDSGVEGTLSTEGLSGNSFEKFKGGVFAKGGTKTTALNSGLDAVFDAGATAAAAQVAAYAQILGLPVEALKGYTESIKISLKDLKEEEVQAAISGAIEKFQGNLAGLFQATISQYQRAGETALQTLQRLSELEAFAHVINEFGGVFSSIATLGIDARESLIGMAGGMEALLAKSRQFVVDFYNPEEQAALAAKSIFDALSAAQINVAGLDTKAEFRALLESRDLNSELGRSQFTALLNQSSAFAQLAPFLEESKKTLFQLQQLAPVSAQLESLFGAGQGAQGSDAPTANLDTLDTSVIGIGNQIAGSVQTLQTSIEAGLAAVAEATRASIAAIERNGRTVSDAILEAQP